MSGQNNGGADPFAAAADHSERLKWYQEVLSLDPDSRIFLPYARLVAGTGRSDTAIDILKKALPSTLNSLKPGWNCSTSSKAEGRGPRPWPKRRN